MHSPLDLSRNSTTHAFFHPPTPDKCSSTSPMDVGRRNPFPYIRQRSRGFPLAPPEILIEPKTEWHYRNMKDLAIQHIPLLSGVGPQRTPIRVSVSSSFLPSILMWKLHFSFFLRSLLELKEPYTSASKFWQSPVNLIRPKWLFRPKQACTPIKLPVIIISIV